MKVSDCVFLTYSTLEDEKIPRVSQVSPIILNENGWRRTCP